MNDAKLNHYFQRTTEHIHRVQNNMLLLVTKYHETLQLSPDERREAMFNVFKHDRSKFSVEQFEAYVELTEFYHQRKVLRNPHYAYPPGIAEKVDAAVKNHYEVENHHPERFVGNCGKYDKLEAIETICDLQAMAQEFNEGSCRNYFEKVWIPKQVKNFYDDYNWAQVLVWSGAAIQCFENEMSQVFDSENLTKKGNSNDK